MKLQDTFDAAALGWTCHEADDGSRRATHEDGSVERAFWSADSGRTIEVDKNVPYDLALNVPVPVMQWVLAAVVK